MPKNHLVFDFETLGQNPLSCAAVNIAYYVFDWERFTSDEPYTFEELIGNIQSAKFDIKDQVSRFGYKIENKTLDWWQSQAPHVSSQIKKSPDDLSLEDFMENLLTYLRDHTKKANLKRWWSRSNTFDPIILERIAHSTETKKDLGNILQYNRVRDIRTYIDTRFNFEIKKNGFCPFDDEEEWGRVFEEHNSIHDVAADILRLQKIERILNCD